MAGFEVSTEDTEVVDDEQRDGGQLGQVGLAGLGVVPC